MAKNIEEKTEISNQFNSFFVSVGEKIPNGVINNGRKTVSSYLK